MNWKIIEMIRLYEAWNQLAEQYEQNLAKRRGKIEVAKETGVEK